MSLRNQRGFSLIELAVVVLIAGLVLAFTTPSINRYLIKARLRDAGSRVAGEMRLARQKAVTNSSHAYFAPVLATNTYLVGERRWLGGSTFSGITWKGPFALPSTVRFSTAAWGALPFFWYTPDGRPTTSGFVRLVSTVGPPDTVTVNVDLSGSVWK